MNRIKLIEKIGSDAVRRLRNSKLANGKPFMITSKDLPAKHTYLEFPDRSIKIVTLSSNGHDFVILNTLNPSEATLLRKKHGLI
ncbi:MAG TPA: hypothetical protein VL125_06195 [Pelobium sp.]|nr:hypothetical protein [Pelobium sp.]